MTLTRVKNRVLDTAVANVGVLSTTGYEGQTIDICGKGI
jgi:hypothetical protein